MASLLSKARIYLRLVWDFTIAVISTCFARLYPKLEVPLVDLDGKVVIITGANSGIGFAIAEALAKRNATVYLACRSTKKGQQAATQILDACGESSSKRVHVLELDTSSMASVRAFAATWTRSSGNTKVDLLYHNAGAVSTPDGQGITSEGLGTIYATNFLGSFLLTSLLEPHIAPGARVIFTSSLAQYIANLRRLFSMPKLIPAATASRKPADSALYADTKGMQVAFAHLLQQRFDRMSPEKQLIAHAFSPGYTFTPIFGKISQLPWYADPLFWVLKAATMLATPVEQGAATGVWLGITSDHQVAWHGKGGRYWDRCVPRVSVNDLTSKQTLDWLWEVWCVDSGAQWSALLPKSP